MITVLLADDHRLVRAGLIRLLATADDINVVGEAADGMQAIGQAKLLSPQVILMDLSMPVLDGIEATRRITSAAETAGTRVIILTTFDLDEYVFSALRAGASGFLLKDTLPADLLTAIRVVAAGDALLAPSVTRRLISEFSRIPADVQRPDCAPGASSPGAAHGPAKSDITRLLTERECEVLRLVATGLSNGEIAERLFISPATAKTHVAHLLAKLDARDRVQLVIIAYQAGLAC